MTLFLHMVWSVWGEARVKTSNAKYFLNINYIIYSDGSWARLILKCYWKCFKMYYQVFCWTDVGFNLITLYHIHPNVKNNSKIKMYLEFRISEFWYWSGYIFLKTKQSAFITHKKCQCNFNHEDVHKMFWHLWNIYR